MTSRDPYISWKSRTAGGRGKKGGAQNRRIIHQVALGSPSIARWGAMAGCAATSPFLSPWHPNTLVPPHTASAIVLAEVRAVPVEANNASGLGPSVSLHARHALAVKPGDGGGRAA